MCVISIFLFEMQVPALRAPGVLIKAIKMDTGKENCLEGKIGGGMLEGRAAFCDGSIL